MTHPWARRGRSVHVAPLGRDDVPILRRAIEGSLDRIAAWGPTGLDSVQDLLVVQGATKRTFLVRALVPDPGAGHDLAARINLNDISGGRLASATLGYDAYEPYAGRGLTREGLALVLDVAFAPEPAGLGLHRVEAAVQPGNVRSAGLLRSLGFVREGFSPRFLRLPAPGEPDEEWRDHDRFALLREDLPAAAYAPARSPRIACVVNGLPGSGKSTLGRRLATELAIPYLGKDVIKEAIAEALPEVAMLADPRWQHATGAGASRAMWGLMRESPMGAVVETWAPPARDREHVRAGLARAGFDPVRVPEVFCDVPVDIARARDRARLAAADRHGIHRLLSDDAWAEAARSAGPLDLGPVLRIDTSRPLSDAQVCRLALTIRAAAVTGTLPDHGAQRAGR